MPNETNPSAPSPSSIAPLDPQSVEGIFVEALGKEPGEPRNDFLATACQGNAELRTRVEALLRAYHDAGSFLQQPAGDWRHPALTAAAGPAAAELDDHGIPRGLLRPSDQVDSLGAIGPYQVRELIGRGGMGIVLRAFDAKLNRIVAIKVLAPGLAAQPTARRRFLREAQAAAAVVHPHVVTIHAVDEDERPYLVMECIEGCSLEDKIARSGTLKLAEVLRIGTQIAEGLAAAHEQGLIHRDVKPANILLENGVERVKITDFGLARAADDVTITRPGEISGTPQYMSPEQASGQRVDQRSDLFSLGCVLYAMCAGQPPFRADSMAAIVRKICDDEPQPLREIDPQVPQWLAETIHRLLAKDPNQRFQTAAEVAQLLGDALARLQAGQSVASVAARAAIPPPALAKPLLPAWLTIVFSGLAGYWFGRLLPMPAGRNEGWWFMAAVVVAATWMYFRVRGIRSKSSTLAAIFVAAGIVTFLVASGIGHDQLFRHGMQFDLADGLVASLTLLLISAAALTWRNPRSWWYPAIQEMRAASQRGPASVPSSGPPRPSSSVGQGRQDGPEVRPSDGSLRGQPWKLAGWLVVALLSLVLLVPVLIAIALVVPLYQSHRAQGDARAWQANAARLKLEFDEDLPIVDIQVDGASNGPIEISPIECLERAGAHTITVVYSHGDRKRSVRETVDLAPREERTLDLTPLVVGDMEARDKAKEDASRAPADGDEANIVWGRAAERAQLGWRIEPKNDVYAAGDLFAVTLFLRNVGPEPISSSIPRTEILEKLGLDIDLRDSNGKMLLWRWGPGHKLQEELTVSGALATKLEPNVPFELPPFTVAVGQRPEPAPGSSETIMVELLETPDVPGERLNVAELNVQTLALTFKLSRFGYARGDEAELETEPFRFRLAERDR